MRPTYYELLQLNPLLQSRSPEEVEALRNVGIHGIQNKKGFTIQRFVRILEQRG